MKWNTFFQDWRSHKPIPCRAAHTEWAKHRVPAPPPTFRVCVHLLTPKETIFHNYMEAKKQCINLLMTKWNLYSVVPENIHTPPHHHHHHGGQQKFQGKGGVQKEAISQGVGSVLSRVFPRAPSKIGELLNTGSCSVEQAIRYFTVNSLSKQ